MAWHTLLVYMRITTVPAYNLRSRKSTGKKHAKAKIRHTLGTVKARVKYC